MSFPQSDDYTSAASFVNDRSAGASVGGRLRGTVLATVTNVGHTSAQDDVADVYSEVVVATMGANACEAGAYLRFNVTTPTYYQANLTRTSAGVYSAFIYKYNGSFVTLATTTGLSITLPSTVRFVAQGTRLTMLVDGVSTLVVEDTEYRSGTCGAYVYAVTSLANTELESWNADVPAALTTPYRVQSIGTAVATVVNGPPNTLDVSFAAAQKPQTGDKIVAYLARDNIANDPATGDSITTTPGSETYTRVALAQPSGTSTANAGIVGAAFYADVVSTWAGGTNTVTATMPDAPADRVFYVEHWRNLGALRGTADTNGSTTNASATTTDPTTGDVVIAMSCWEHSSASTVTADADTTNGSWSAATPQLASGGTTTAAVKLITQFKIVTATGNQTYNPTNSTTADSVAIALTFAPAAAATAAPPPASRYYYKTAMHRAATR